MNPLLGPIISGGLPIIGGLLGGSSARQQNAEERAWQEHMASTQYQRGVKDMRAAGLNPAMLYGRGAMSSPVGGGARMEEGRHLAEGVMRGGAAALSAALTQAQIDEVHSGAKLKDAQAEAVLQDKLIQQQDWMGKQINRGTALQPDWDLASWGRLQRQELETRIAETLVRTENMKQSTAESRAREALLKVQQLSAKLGIPEAEAWSRYWKSVGMYGVAVELSGDVVRSIGGLTSAFKSLKPGVAGGANSARRVYHYLKGKTP